MSNITIPYNKTGYLANGNPSREVTTVSVLTASNAPGTYTGSISTDDNVFSYIAKDASSGRIYLVVKHLPPAGQTVTVNVTINASDVNGNALPPVVQAFDIVGPPPPPPVTHIAAPVWTLVNDFTAFPADPGVSTIALP